MRTLTLRKDTLAELTPAELAGIAGAAGTGDGITSPCVTRPVTGIWCLSVVCAE